MNQIRRITIRCFCSAGPGLLLIAVVCMAGLGLHAARDWHRHGEISAGFFHLHFHVGHHEHHDHEHQAPTDHDPNTPDGEAPERTAVFTLSLAVHQVAPIASSPTPPVPSLERALIISPFTLPNSGATPFAQPRAPPA